MRLKDPIVLIAVGLMLLTMPGLVAQTKPFKMTISGSGGFPLEMVEMGEDLITVGMGICGGNSNLGGGKYLCTTSGFWRGETVGLDTERCPGGVEFVYTYAESSHIVRLYTGDVISMVPLFDGDNNYYCLFECDPAEHDCPMMGFYVVDYRAWQIIGGSGPYQGATGEVAWEMRVDPVPYVFGEVQWAIHPSPFNGYITLEK